MDVRLNLGDIKMEVSNKIVIAGGTGFIGNFLLKELGNAGYDLVLLSRSVHQGSQYPVLQWDGKTVGPWQKELENALAVINLSGHSIRCRWTPENKEKIFHSRMDTTKAIAKAVANCSNPPSIWMNASAAGIYGEIDPSPIGGKQDQENSFLLMVRRHWEKIVQETEVPMTRKLILRFGMVLGQNGEAFETLKHLTKMFIGGSAGKGDQIVDWIHIKDVVCFILFGLTHEIGGPVNLVSPNPVPNKVFMATFRKVFHRPWAPSAPEFLVRLMSYIMHVEPSLLLRTEKVFPQQVLDAGFEFSFPELESALRDLAQ